jgi:hypothetical protein
MFNISKPFSLFRPVTPPSSEGSKTVTPPSSVRDRSLTPPSPFREDDLAYREGVFPGAQGCIFVPSLIVEGLARNRNKQYVTKIFIDEESYNYEKRLNAFVKQIDPTSSFTNVKYNENPINLSLVKDQDIRNCGAIINTREELATKKFLNYEYLGQSLHTIIGYNVYLNISHARDILFGLSKLASKIYLMNQGRLGVVIYHNDDHYGNIMYNPRTRSVYLIDFGKATTGKPLSGNTLVDMELLISSTNTIVDYILKTVPSIPKKGGESILKFKEFIDTNYLGRRSPPRDFVKTYTSEDIVKAITELASNFAEEGGRRQTKKKLLKKRKTLRRVRH